MGKREMTPSEAWKIVLPELAATTVDIWTDADYEDEPVYRQIAADIEAGVITPDVLSEIENKLTFDYWTKGKLYQAALTVLAANGRLEAFDPNATYSRRPRTKIVLGKRYIV